MTQSAPPIDDVGVLIVGAGTVGLTLAIDLGWRGVPCHLVEAELVRPANPRCNTAGARSMEHFRRLGLAEQIRAAGLPPSFPTTISYRTQVIGEEIFRLEHPSAGIVRSATGAHAWPTPEPQHRISQIFLEPILETHVRGIPDLTLERGARVTGLTDEGDHVTVALESPDGCRTVRARYVVGCDGAHSTVRRALGIRYQGVDAIKQFVSTYVRSAQLGRLMLADPAWTTWTYHQDCLSALIAIDGDQLWLNHNVFAADHDTSSEDPRRLLIRAVGRSVDYEQIGLVRWTGRQLVAERYGRGRILLAGDAAHIWIPIAGFGMNAGIQDATDLAWKLAAIHNGWAGEGLLDSYEHERRPVGDQIARAVKRAAAESLEVTVDDQLGASGAAGQAARSALAEQLALTEPPRYDPVGLNFAYNYADSPLVWPIEAPVPELRIDRYDPVAIPGFRLPHIWRSDGSSIFDQLGRDFTLLRTGDQPRDVGIFQTAARERGIPLAQLDVPEREAAELYGAPLLLVRPDQHIAWSGDVSHTGADEILDRAIGAAPPNARSEIAHTEESP